ncbi:unnamed protein product [Amoebophrya sp. A25]|nr:unnamed protein product [Amoebophrya sp. A25]|eukprot:GSA25T00017777001.1
MSMDICSWMTGSAGAWYLCDSSPFVESQKQLGKKSRKDQTDSTMTERLESDDVSASSSKMLYSKSDPHQQTRLLLFIGLALFSLSSILYASGLSHTVYTMALVTIGQHTTVMQKHSPTSTQVAEKDEVLEVGGESQHPLAHQHKGEHQRTSSRRTKKGTLRRVMEDDVVEVQSSVQSSSKSSSRRGNLDTEFLAGGSSAGMSSSSSSVVGGGSLNLLEQTRQLHSSSSRAEKEGQQGKTFKKVRHSREVSKKLEGSSKYLRVQALAQLQSGRTTATHLISSSAARDKLWKALEDQPDQDSHCKVGGGRHCCMRQMFTAGDLGQSGNFCLDVSRCSAHVNQILRNEQEGSWSDKSSKKGGGPAVLLSTSSEITQGQQSSGTEGILAPPSLAELSKQQTQLSSRETASTSLFGSAGALTGARKYAFVLSWFGGRVPAFSQLGNVETTLWQADRMRKLMPQGSAVDVVLLVYVARHGDTEEKKAEIFEQGAKELRDRGIVVKRVLWDVPPQAKFQPTGGWCGHQDLIRIHAFGLTDYDAIAYYDNDVELRKPTKLLEMFHCVDGADVTLSTGGGIGEPLNVGYFAMKPSANAFNAAVTLTETANYNLDYSVRGRGGWADMGFAPVGGYFIGAECGQGFWTSLFYRMDNPVVRAAWQAHGVTIDEGKNRAKIRAAQTDRCTWNYQTSMWCESLPNCDKVVAQHKPDDSSHVARQQDNDCLKKTLPKLKREVALESSGMMSGVDHMDQEENSKVKLVETGSATSEETAGGEQRLEELVRERQLRRQANLQANIEEAFHVADLFDATHGGDKSKASQSQDPSTADSGKGQEQVALSGWEADHSRDKSSVDPLDLVSIAPRAARSAWPTFTRLGVPASCKQPEWLASKQHDVLVVPPASTGAASGSNRHARILITIPVYADLTAREEHRTWVAGSGMQLPRTIYLMLAATTQHARKFGHGVLVRRGLTKSSLYSQSAQTSTSSSNKDNANKGSSKLSLLEHEAATREHIMMEGMKGGLGQGSLSKMETAEWKSMFQEGAAPTHMLEGEHLLPWQRKDCQRSSDKKLRKELECGRAYWRENANFAKHVLMWDYLNMEMKNRIRGGMKEGQMVPRFTHVGMMDADAMLMNYHLDSLGILAYQLQKTGKDVFFAAEDWLPHGDEHQKQLNRERLNGGFLFAKNNDFSRKLFSDTVKSHEIHDPESRGRVRHKWALFESGRLAKNGPICSMNEQMCLNDLIWNQSNEWRRKHVMFGEGLYWNRGSNNKIPFDPAKTHVAHLMGGAQRFEATQMLCDKGMWNYVPGALGYSARRMLAPLQAFPKQGAVAQSAGAGGGGLPLCSGVGVADGGLPTANLVELEEVGQCRDWTEGRRWEPVRGHKDGGANIDTSSLDDKEPAGSPWTPELLAEAEDVSTALLLAEMDSRGTALLGHGKGVGRQSAAKNRAETHLVQLHSSRREKEGKEIKQSSKNNIKKEVAKGEQITKSARSMRVAQESQKLSMHCCKEHRSSCCGEDGINMSKPYRALSLAQNRRLAFYLHIGQEGQKTAVLYQIERIQWFHPGAIIFVSSDGAADFEPFCDQVNAKFVAPQNNGGRGSSAPSSTTPDKSIKICYAANCPSAEDRWHPWPFLNRLHHAAATVPKSVEYVVMLEPDTTMHTAIDLDGDESMQKYDAGGIRDHNPRWSETMVDHLQTQARKIKGKEGYKMPWLGNGLAGGSFYKKEAILDAFSDEAVKAVDWKTILKLGHGKDTYSSDFAMPVVLALRGWSYAPWKQGVRQAEYGQAPGDIDREQPSEPVFIHYSRNFGKVGGKPDEQMNRGFFDKVKQDKTAVDPCDGVTLASLADEKNAGGVLQEEKIEKLSHCIRSLGKTYVKPIDASWRKHAPNVCQMCWNLAEYKRRFGTDKCAPSYDFEYPEGTVSNDMAPGPAGAVRRMGRR